MRLLTLTLLVACASALYENGSVVAPCDSPLYCQGDVLKSIELAQPFSDSKTFVDMPTTRSLADVLAAYNKLQKPLSNNTELQTFLSTYFGKAGGELEEVPATELHTDPAFLDDIDDPVVKEFTQKVIGIWPDLTRRYVGAGNCSDCANSFIPVNRTFVVAGGRFREPYYWDSFWIIEGLLRTGGTFTSISKNIIENFLDLVDKYGFMPNGARIYYLNRSQPPLLSQMVRIYVEYTNDTSILTRALPVLIKEHDFWMKNRTVQVLKGGKKYTLNQYAVRNNQPRPESYREDYIVANNQSYYSTSGKVYPQVAPLSDQEKATLYANLASEAEAGWDFGTRFIANPADAVRDNYFPLRSLNTINIVPVDLNSILYMNEMAIAGFLELAGNEEAASKYRDMATDRSDAVHNLMWNEKHFSYFDYNLTSSAQNIYVVADSDATVAETSSAPAGMQVLFDIAQFYPFWTGAASPSLKNQPSAVSRAFERVATLIKQRAGGIPATNVRTGQQWDQPNVWPPLMYVLMRGLLNTARPHGSSADTAYTSTQDLALALGQRYLDSTFCTWWATGGSTTLTPQLAGADPKSTGTMFEKYADNSTNVAGGGGEYAVVEGFGWTNGVLIWTVDTFGNDLKRPDCGNITAANVHPAARRRGLAPRANLAKSWRSAVELDWWDAKWIKMFGSRANLNSKF